MGGINRITIMVCKYTGQPKGFAYIEFAEESTVANAQLLNDSLFRGRQLKVIAKRTNIPGYAAGKGKGKGKGKPKGKGKGAPDPFGYMYGAYPMMPYRPRPRYRYRPY